MYPVQFMYPFSSEEDSVTVVVGEWESSFSLGWIQIKLFTSRRDGVMTTDSLVLVQRSSLLLIHP